MLSAPPERGLDAVGVAMVVVAVVSISPGFGRELPLPLEWRRAPPEPAGRMQSFSLGKTVIYASD